MWREGWEEEGIVTGSACHLAPRDGAIKFFSESLKEYLILLRIFFLTDRDRRRGVAGEEETEAGRGTEC